MKRVLLVDDDPEILLLLKHVLLSAGYDVETADTARGALQYLNSNSYHLVLTDERLPDGRGLLIADRAKQIGTRVVIITGYAPAAGAVDLAEYDLLLKPIRPAEIVEVVRQCIGDVGNGSP